MEILSLWVRESIENALVSGDIPTLTKFGRFLGPFAAQIQRASGKSIESSYVQRVTGKLLEQQLNGPACVE